MLIGFFLHPWSSVLSQGLMLFLVILYFSVSVELLSCFNLQPGLSLFQKCFLLKKIAFSVLVTLFSSSGIPIIHMLVLHHLPSI